MLEIRNLAFRYGRNPILHDISFDVGEGTTLAVLGPNGSGKTTLIRCIHSILKPRSGTVLLDGTRIDSLSPENTARRIAYMPQRGDVSGMTVFDAVLLGRKPHIGRRPAPDDFAKVEQTLLRLELGDKALRPIDRLSGGEMQKVALARMLVQETRLLLLDEPTGSLDLKNRIEILSLIRRFVRENRLIALLSIHDMNDALRFADRLLFLKDGKVLADETPETLAERTIESVYGLPVALHETPKSKFIIPR